jgi:cyclophilin family peptidyl-prolyl cis-trans isomerase
VSKANKRERQRENRERAREERERMVRRDKQWRTVRGLLFVLVPVAAVFLVVVLTRGDDGTSSKPEPTRSFKAPPKQTIDPNKTYTAQIETSRGTITVRLDPKQAPVATNNFVFLARKHFYDGLCIDRAAKSFVIQGGSPKCDQQGGPGYTVEGEVPTDGYPVGALAAAKSPGDPPGSFGSQFFIVTGGNASSLPNEYARFGEVTSGLEVAQAIEQLAPANGDGKPTKKVTIDRVKIAEG